MYLLGIVTTHSSQGIQKGALLETLSEWHLFRSIVSSMYELYRPSCWWLRSCLQLWELLLQKRLLRALS